MIASLKIDFSKFLGYSTTEEAVTLCNCPFRRNKHFESLTLKISSCTTINERNLTVLNSNDSVERLVQYAQALMEFTDKCGVERLDNLAKHLGVDIKPQPDALKEIENAGIQLSAWQKAVVSRAIKQDIEAVWYALGVVEENRQRNNPCANNPAELLIKALQHKWKPNIAV